MPDNLETLRLVEERLCRRGSRCRRREPHRTSHPSADRPDHGSAGHAGAAGRPRRHGGQHRPDRRDLPRARRAWRPHIKGQKTIEHRAQARSRRAPSGSPAPSSARPRSWRRPGIRNILIANQIVGPIKIAPAGGSARRWPTPIVAVDSLANVAASWRAAAQAAGGHRCRSSSRSISA